MFQPSQEELSGYVYRRIAPPHFKVKRNWAAPDAFLIAPAMRGLSVFRADMATPRQVLQECIEDRRKRLVNADEAEQPSAAAWLAKNPDVETLVQKEYRVVAIPIAALQVMGFANLEESEANGHLNIVGTPEQFAAQAEAFVELIDTGQAHILTADQCLKQVDVG